MNGAHHFVRRSVDTLSSGGASGSGLTTMRPPEGSMFIDLIWKFYFWEKNRYLPKEP
jgi:hypothetical protein